MSKGAPAVTVTQIPVPERVLVIKLRAIGDVVMATPVIDNLRAAWPQAQIDFLTEKMCFPIVKDHPEIDDHLVFDRFFISNAPGTVALRENLNFLRQLRRKRYDVVFDLFGNPRTALFTLATGARYRVGYNFRGRKYAYNIVVPNRGDHIHEVLFNLDALQAVGVPVTTTKLRVEVTGLHAAFADDFFRRAELEGSTVIGLNVSGGWYTKKWPLASFAGLADRLVAQYGVKILIFWGPGELYDARAVQEAMQQPAVLAPQADLHQLAALLQKTDLLISNDSGPLHLATAVGTRVAGIYGPTRPDLQGPWGDWHFVVRKDELDCLGCHGVTCRISTHDCMQKLSVNEVFEKIVPLLKGLKK